jgi:hypothetical protein
MKVLVAVMILMALSGCENGHFFPKTLGHELAYRCDINPYDPDCLDPPPVFKSW